MFTAYGFCNALYEPDPPTQDFWPDDPPWEEPAVPDDHVPDYPWLERAVAEMRQRQGFAEQYHQLQVLRHREKEKEVAKESVALHLVTGDEEAGREDEQARERSDSHEPPSGFQPRLIRGQAKPKSEALSPVSFTALNRNGVKAPFSPLQDCEPHSFEPYNIWEQDGPADRKILLLSADEALQEFLITAVDEYSPRELWPHLRDVKRTLKAVEKHLKAEEGPPVKRMLGRVRCLFENEPED